MQNPATPNQLLSFPERKSAARATAALALLAILSACSNPESTAARPPVAASSSATGAATSPNVPTQQETDLNNPIIKHRAEQIISTFENSTTEIQYNYAENIEDGRGITAGRAGFTSGTHDLLMVVERYADLTQDPNNALSAYLEALKAADGTESTKGLEGFVNAWQITAESDPALKQAQDEIYDLLYFAPAMNRAKDSNVKTAIGQLIILDTIIQHGEGDDPDGLPAILNENQQTMNGPVNGNEVAWLSQLLEIRRKHLQHAADPETRAAWRESVSRVDALMSILKSGNLNLDPPLKWSVYGDRFALTS